MPRLKPETIKQKIATLDVQVAQLNAEIEEIESNEKEPLQNRYLSKCPAGGSSFAGKKNKQVENTYWVLYQSNPRKRVRNINQREVDAVRKQVEAGKRLTKLSKQLDKLTKSRADWQRKL